MATQEAAYLLMRWADELGRRADWPTSWADELGRRVGPTSWADELVKAAYLLIYMHDTDAFRWRVLLAVL